MIRTQIYLPEAIHKRLTKIRETTGVSIASFIREAVEQRIGHTDTAGDCDILKLSELGITGGEKDLSQNINCILYGEKD